MNKEKRPMIKVSVGSLYYALNAPLENGQFDPAGYPDVINSPVIKSVGVTDETANENVYASGIVYENVSEVSSTDLSIEVIAFDPEDLYALRGEVVGENGIVLGGGSSERPHVAIGYPIKKKGGKAKFVWYPKCKLVENTDDIATKEESFSEQNDTLTFTALAFNDAGNNKIEIDTETLKGAAATEEDFFRQVIVNPEDYTPGA